MKLPFILVNRKRWDDRHKYTKDLEDEYINLRAEHIALTKIHDATKVGVPILQKKAFNAGKQYMKRKLLEHARRVVK